MNFGAIYSDAVGRTEPEVKEDNLEEKALERQNRNKWIEQKYTSELLNFLVAQEQEKLLNARALACSGGTKEMESIIRNLQASKTINEIITYATRGNK